ncbi:MAG: helix-turn-helix transcriptional regulator [Nitrospira sp.]|nr:helix-turn-helix transcriptional regulator [Nitrospira sp.]
MSKSRKTAPFSSEYRRFCRLLKEAREEAGITQVVLAKHLRKHQSYVAKYESGERRLDVIEFLRIAQVLSADPAILLRRIQIGSIIQPQSNIQ